ncbi:hyalin-like [Diadema setosum]|uniref:hyalin-like n=1 Tax=Diadema setosum TaxID=31175 RepID=UPI003B3B8828
MDGAGNAATCQFVINVLDAEAPNITCPPDVTQPTDPGLYAAIVSWSPPYIVDNSGNFTVTATHSSGDEFSAGNTTVTITAEDESGNGAAYRESPNITCPEDIRDVQEPGSYTVNVSWPAPLVADNSGSFTPPRSEPESGSLFAIGQTTVVITSSDQNGNIGRCQFTVTIDDFNECSNASHDCHENARCINAQGNFTCECNDGYTDLRPPHPGRLCEDVDPPTISGCPASQSKPTLPGLPYALFSWIEPNASDTSMEVTLAFNGPGENGGRYNISDYNVTYTAIDSAGNTAVCFFEISVRDEEFPNITCPEDITQSTDAGLYSADVSWPDTQIIDNSESVSIQANYTSGDMFPVGNTTVVIAVEDESGNEVICIFVITITDRESPNITCPEDIVKLQDPNSATVNVSWSTPSVADNSGNFTPPVSSPESGSVFGLGETTVNVTSYDGNGNVGICQFTVIVTDVTAPTFRDCPADQSVSTLEGLPYANVSWKEPVVIDISGTMSLIFNGPGTNGGPYNIGEYNVTYTASDEAGNTANCSFIITVIDYELPNVTCPDDIELELNPETAAANVSWSQPTVTDNSGFFSLAPSQPPLGSLFQVGTTTVNVTASDPSGNIGYCLFLVNLIDYDECSNDVENCHDNATCVNTKGTFTCQCREGYLDLDPRNPGRSCQDIDECASVSDCHSNATCINTDGNFTCECNGGFDDQNIAYPGRSCEDVTPPEINDCPDSQSLPTLPGRAYTYVTWVEPMASDTSSVVSLAFNGPDSESPNITCPGDIEVAQAQGSKTANVSWVTPVVVDNSGFFTEPISSPESGALFDLGNTTVTVTSRDESGNVGSCQFTVTVIDVVPPVITDCPNSQSLSTMPGLPHSRVSWTEPLAADNSDQVSLVFNGPGTNNGTYSIGEHNVSYTAIDDAGNMATCQFVVTIVDQERPSIVCPEDITQPQDEGSSVAVVSWQPAVVTDNSGSSSPPSSLPPSGSSFDLGVTTVNVTSQDPSDNQAFCLFNVSIIDKDA